MVIADRNGEQAGMGVVLSSSELLIARYELLSASWWIVGAGWVVRLSQPAHTARMKLVGPG